ncbi:polycystin-1-like [Ylistrum balloti]|uniref:polycystin-1-like n=1 Tax=Ylistrum balloti TaxID=509963 RepID=UPI002905E1C8|nr:polycystin-1-like [Ylistrum balloti]
MTECKRGRQSLGNDARPGRPVTVATLEMVSKVHDIVMDAVRVTERYIDSALRISQEGVHSILTEDLAMRKIPALWVELVPDIVTLGRALYRNPSRCKDITLCGLRGTAWALMAIHQSLPGRRSMLKVDKSRTISHHGFPRALRQPRMCCLSFGLLLFLCWGQGVGASPSPCPSMCKCYSVDSTSTNCVVDCTNANISSLTEIPSADLPSSSWRVVQLSLAGNLITKFKDKSFEVPSLITLDLSDNPVTSFERLMFTSSSSITTLYINKMNLTSLPPYLFTNLMLLENLYLRGNNISFIPNDAFSSNPNLTVLDASSNQIQSLEVDTFYGLTSLQYLDISNNKLVFLNASMFRDMHTSLTSLNVAFNDWVCQCSLAPFVEYLVTFNNSAGNTLINWQNATCIGQPDQVLLTLNSQFLCATNYFSCYNDTGAGTVSTVIYSTVISSATATSQQICTEECFQVSTTYALYTDSFCLCGNSSSDYNCGCSINTNYADQDSETCTDSGGSTDSKTYLANVSTVSAGIFIHPIARLTAGQSHTFTVNVTLNIINMFMFHFGDTSNVISEGVTGNTFSISYTYLVPAQYTLTVSGCYTDGTNAACESVSVPVLVDPLDSQVSVSLSSSSYEGSINTASISASFTMGQDLDFYWVRSPDNGVTSNTSYSCETSWTFARGRCLQMSSSALDYDTAKTSCTNSLLNTIQHSTEVTEFATEILAVSSSLTSVYIEAKKNGSFYQWADNSYTYFSVDDLVDSSVGDCVIIDLTINALKGADCSATHNYVCQKPPNNACPHGGVYYPTTRNCYLAVTSSPVSWSNASTACQAIATDASLATFDSAQLVSHVTSTVLPANTEAWVGLRYIDGYQQWVNSESVSAYTPSSSSTTGDCFSLSQDGAWKGYPCSTTLSYICQYSVVKDTVTVEASGVGTMNLNPTSHTYTLNSLSTLSSTPSSAAGIVTIFPGHTVSTHNANAKAIAWNFKTANLTTSQTVAFQVWRPVCKASETFVTPGCNGIGGKYGSCKTTTTTCPAVMSCAEGTKYCFHDDSCKPVGDVCDCTGCTESYVESAPTYVLIGQAFVVIPAAAFQSYTILAGETDIQSNDIIGYQADTGNDVVLCETGGDWAQNTQQATVSSWLSVGDTFNVTAWKNNTMCYVNVIYSTPVSMTMPSSLGYFTTSGQVDFQLSVPDPVITRTKAVTSQEIVGSLVWLWPSLQVGQTTDTIFVEEATSIDLLLVTNFGTDLTANWTFGSTSTLTTFTSACPTSFVSSSVCSPYTNWPALPFSTTSHTFDTDMDVYVEVFNQVSSTNLTVAVRVFEVISSVSIALTSAQSNNYVAYDEQTSFSVTVGTGTPTVYNYYVNGSLEYTANTASFSHKFLNTSVPYHVVTVNASDDYSYALAEIGVTVKVRANFQNFQFTNVPSILEENTQYEYGASVEATIGAEVSVMWIFGIGSPQLVTTTIASSTQQFNLNFTYSQTGSYSVAIFLQDDSFLSAKYISSSIDIAVAITTVTLSTSTAVILEGDSITFTPSLPGPSYYGRTIYYTYEFQDGTTLINQTTTSVSHVFSTKSSPVDTVTLTAMNGISSGNTSVDITVEEPITSLSLTGPSPILINTTQQYTAAVVTGSHITYSFQEPALGLASAYISADNYNWTISTVGVYNLTVIANNTFATLSESLEVRAVDSDTLQILSFTHDRYIVTSTSVVFKVDVLSLDSTSVFYLWEFGDGDTTTGTGLTETSHSFVNPDNYTVTVTLYDNVTSVQTFQSSPIGVQDTVTNLRVVGSGIGNIVSGAAATVVLTASVDTGTDVWYTYTYAGSNFSTSNTTFGLEYSTATELMVDVVAANQISFQNITISVTFQETIESLAINCSECTVAGGNNYLATNATSTYTATVGVGTSVTYTFSVAGQPNSNNNPLSQVFSVNGDVFVNVTAENKVSSAEYSLPIVVQDTITSLEFDSSITNAILINTNLTMDTIIVGSHATYSWRMCSTCSVITGSSSSYVNPGYTASGSYTVTVVGSNQISSATATLALTVHEPVTAVNITSNDLVNGMYVPIDTVTTFTATSNIALHVYYDWTIYNSTGMTVSTVFNTDNLTHSFNAEGEYYVKVTALNSASSKETNLTVIVETPISGVSISNNNTSPIATLEGLGLTAMVTRGSTLTYTWNQNNTALGVTSADLAVAISPSGTYVYSVVVTNPLGSVTSTVTYVVLDVIENATIILPSGLVYYPFAAINSAVQFSASVPKGDQVTIAWEMQQAGVISSTGSTTTFDYTFASVANYTLTMNATNDVSSMVETTEISIQTPLTSLSMTASSSAAETNATVTFTGVHNADADHLTYEWTIDSVINTTTTNSITHSFSTARTYIVSLNVSNQISTYNTYVSVEIEDPIQGLSISNCNTTINVTDLAQAVAVITQGTNVTYLWSVDVDNGTIQQSGKTFGYSFTQTAVYNLNLNVSNLVSTDVASCWYTITGPISDVTITMSDDIYLFVNYTVDFAVTGNNLVGVIYNWSISPISYSTTTETGALSKMFTVKQSYVLTLTVSNNINSVTVTKSFYIDELSCTSPVITAGGVTSKTVYKANSVMFEVYINRFTCDFYDLQYNWTAYNLTSSGELLDNPVTLTDVIVTTPKLLLTNGTLDYGEFCIVLDASYSSTPLQQRVMFNVTVLKTELVAVIAGGITVKIPANTSYHLDGSSSYDKDHTSSLTNSWSCSKISGSAAADACTSVSGSSSSISIPASKLIEDQIYDITLTVSATDRTSGSYTQRLIVGASEAPLVDIVCVSCLASYQNVISSATQLALQGSCANCGSATVTYSWTATYIDSGITQTFSLTDTSTHTGDSVSNLVVKSGQIINGKTYTFTLTVTKTENSVTTTSYAVIELQANLPPYGTDCTVSSTTITVFSTLSVDCQGFSDPDSNSTELMYEVIAYSTDSASVGQYVIIYSGPKSQVDVYLTSWSGVSRATVQVKVFVIDSFNGVYEGLDTTITVNGPTLTAGQTMADYLWEKANGEMLGLVKENSPTLLLQYAITMIHEINELSRVATTDTEKYRRASLRNILTLTVLGLPLEDRVARQQAAFFMDHLTVYSDEFQTSACQDLVLSLTQTLKAVMESGVRQGLEQSSVLTNHLLGAVANVMSGVNMAVYSSSTSLVSGWYNDTMQIYIPSVSSFTNVFSSSSLSGESHRRSVVTKALSQAEGIIALNLKSMLLGQAPLVYTINSMAAYGVRTTSDNLNLDYVGADSGITVSSNTLTGSSIVAGTEIFQIYINSDPSPFTWGYTADFVVDTKMASLTLKDTTGADISVSGLSDADSVQLVLTDEEENVNITNASIVGNTGYDQTKNLNYIYSNVNSDTPKLITLTPSSGVDGSALFIQVAAKNIDNASPEAKAAPSQASFYLGIDIANPSASENTQAIELIASDTLPADHRDHTFYINNFDSSKTYRISVYVNDTYMLNVSSAVYMGSCMYYDTTELAWSTSGCQPTSECIAIALVCKCNHLTAFGGGMLVPIDAISFSDLEFIDLYTNPVVFVTATIIFVVYIVAVIISRRLDLRDLERISSVPLCGKDGSFKYEITLVTGRQRGAGTSAHVGIKLYGDYGKSNRKHLSKKGAFQRNCQDSFIIAHDTNLGDISKVFVWHDNHGLDPNWYLVQVIVRDLQTDQKYYFFGNVWLTLEKENGYIQKEIYAAGSAEIQRFTRIFGHAWSSSVADRHLWVSIMDRPANSRFTRVQRTTCIVTILYVFMCINIIWYGIIKTTDSNLNTTSFGWQEVVVALATNAVVFPFSIILIGIFKKSRSKNNVFEQGNRLGTAETIEIDNNCDRSTYSSFQTNEDLISYLGERESTSESIRTAVAAPPKILGLRRTQTLKTSLKLDKVPSSADSFNSSINGDKNDRKLERTNNPGKWEQDSFKESWHKRLKPKSSTDEPQPNTSAPIKQDRAAVRAEVEDAADDIMEYLDMVEADMISKEQMLRKNKDPSKLTLGLSRKPPVHRPSTDEGKHWNKDKNTIEPKKGALKRKDSTHSVGISAVSSNSYAIPSSSGMQRNFTPREEPSLADRKPTSAGSVAKWVSKLKPGGIRSNDMPSVEHTNTLGTHPLRPNSMLARQISQPDIITHGVVGSFTMEGNDIRKKKSGCTLPPWCVYVGYFLCFCLSVLSVIVVMLYGYQLGAEIALQWVLALLFSVAFSFLMFETLKALFMALYIAGIEKKVDPYDENDVIDIEPIVDNAVETVKEMKFKPLAGFSLVKAREEGQKVQRMRLMLRQFVAYMFYLWLLMVLCYVNFSSSQYYFTYSTENHFIKTTVSNDTYSFQNMTSIEEFWVWSQEVLSPGLHWEEFENYTEYATLLGTARLRQVRSLTEKCMAYDSLIVLGSPDFLSGKTCVGSGSFDEDQNSYGETWTSNQAQNLSWNYYTSDLTGSKWRQGNVFSYSGGGYVQFLGTNYTETLSILQDLQAKDWINLHTRAVFVDFTMYNPATDLTTYVNLLVELPLTGSVNTSYEIHSQKLLRYIDDIVDPLLVCEAILFVVVVYLWIHMALLIRDEGCSFFTKAWNLYELLTTVMAMAVIGLYVGCVVQATFTFDEYLANSSSFVNFETTIDVHLSMRYTQAWLLFLLMFKVVKQLRFIKVLYIYEKTLSESVGKLFGVALIFAILFQTHGMLAYLWYGPYVGGFESYWHTLTTLLGAIRGTFDFWLLFEHSRVFSHFFFYSFYIFVYGLTIGFIVAILSDTYKTLRSQMFFKSTLDMQDHEMIDFTMKRFKMWAGITKPKPEFRAVRFPGLPSVSSRCTSRSSTRSFSETSISSDGLSMLSTGGSANAAARLSSTWQDVLRTMERVTHLDVIEEDLIKKCQREIDEWKWQNRISSMEKENDGLLNWTTKKTPTTPNTRTTKIHKRVPTQPRLTAKSEGTAKTPPSKPVKGKATPRASRPLSDQGGRAAQRMEQPGPSQDRKSVFDFFKSVKPSKPAW